MENIAEQATAAAVAGAMPRFADGTIIEEVFQGAAWQRCVVHLMRSAASCAPTRQKRAAVLAVLKAVFAEADPDLVRELYHLACGEIASFCPKAAELLEDAEC